MNIIIASSNKGKIKELQTWLEDHNVITYSEILGSLKIEETGKTFQENAILKAQAIMDKLNEIDYKHPYIIISDDSGITVPALNNEPNIYSARYAGIDATDAQNNEKLISKLNEKNLQKTKAYYTACLAVGFKNKIYTTHGWMHGEVINKQIGEKGFGYDPLFIPDGYENTLGILENNIKKDLSHRSKALRLAMKIVEVILK